MAKIEMNFLHNGAMGDIIYSLPTVIAFGGGNFYCEKNKQFEVLSSLLKLQPYLNQVAPYNKEIKIDANLSVYRKEDWKHKHLCRCHLDPFDKEYDLSQSWLSAIEPNHKADIVICRTRRYHDKKEIDWSILKKYENRVLFVGDEKDYNILAKEYGLNVERYWCKDALEFAQIIKGSKLYIGNQSLGFALAEAMKHPRVLEVFHEADNCQPNSSNGYTYLNESLIDSHLGETKIVKPDKKNFRAKQGQDKWVLSVLKNKRNGFFVEIGAHNGIDDSNAYVLEKDFGWQGVCVEPHTYSFQTLEEHRSCIRENLCISGTNGKVKFVQRGRSRQVSGILDDFSDDVIIEKAKNGHPIIEKDSITLLNLLKKHRCPKIIEYLSIDVEGAEFDILEKFPFDEYKFLTMTIEHNAQLGERNIEKKNKIFELLFSNGYKKVNSTTEEDWYVYCPNIDSKVISFDEIEPLGNYYRSIGKKIVSTNGCFDILHHGHISFLEECKSFGDVLVVGLNDDKSIISIKGENRPIIDENSRISIMSHIDLIDHVCVFKESTPCKMLGHLKTDIHCKDSNYSIDEIIEKQIVEDNGGKIKLIKNNSGYSTTNIIKKIEKESKKKLKIGVIVIATGLYLDMIQDPRFDLINSLHTHFFPEDILNIYLFTDGIPPDNVEHIHQEQLPWPYPTLYRFRSFYESKDIYKDNDYMFYIDADSKIVADVSREILSDFTVVKHWSSKRYKRRKKIPVETDKKSTAAIIDPNYLEYYSGAFFGAKTNKFISMSKKLSDNIDEDLKNDIIAVWHDESHLNRYCYENPPALVIDNRYQARISKLHELENTELLKQRDYKIIAVDLVDKTHYRIKK